MFFCFLELSSNGTGCGGERLGPVSTIEDCCQPASIGGLAGEGYTQVGSTSCSNCPANSKKVIDVEMVNFTVILLIVQDLNVRCTHLYVYILSMH